MAVRYEWVVEAVATVDTPEHEAGEVLDTAGADNFVAARAYAADAPEPGTEYQIVLVRDDDAGRAWAYLNNGALPTHFEDAYGVGVAKVPGRYFDEVARATR